MNLTQLFESDMSGVMHAARHHNKSFIITANVDGAKKKFRVNHQTADLAKDKFLQHHSMAKILDVQEEGVAEAVPYGSRNPDTMSPGNYDRYQQDQMDQGKRDFKRQEHDAEWEQEKAYSAKLAAQQAGPWYIRLNGKLLRDKQGNPYSFNGKAAANKAALTMQAKLFNQGKEFMLTTNPNDKQQGVAEEKVRLDPKCWTGKKIGNPKTKVKGGVRVNNCVPAESINEFAPPGGGDGASGRWYTDDELADIIGDDWFQDFDVSNDGFNIDTHGEKAKQNLASYANSWFDDRGYNVNVMGVDHNDVDHDLKWYIVGSFHNPRFADKDEIDEGEQRVDSLVTDALKIMQGATINDAVSALKTVLGNREYNDRRGHYNFYVRQLMDMYGQQGVAEGYNAEYDDEAGMADNKLETLKRAVQGLDNVINAGDNLPEWCQEKIAVSKSMLVSVWDYMLSEKEKN